MKPIRCLVVDDERLARSLVRQLVESVPDLAWAGEADDVASAREAVERGKPEVVFLDIGLPDGDGFDLLGLLGPGAPVVVFVTAYEEHALRAFDFEAVDYLVKPVEPERFDRTVERLRARLRPRGSDDGAGTGQEREPLGTSVGPQVATGAEHLFVKAGRAGRFVAPQEILWVRSDRNYTEVKLVDGSVVLVRQTLSEWARALPSRPFVQLDRTVIVNLARVRITEVSATSALVRFDGASASMVVGRRAAVRLREVMGRGGLGVGAKRSFVPRVG